MDNETNINEQDGSTAEDAADTAADITDLREEDTGIAGEVTELTEVSDEASQDTAAESSDNGISALEGTEEKTEEAQDDPAVQAGEASEAAAAAQPHSKYRFDILKKLTLWVTVAIIFLSAFGITAYYVTTASKAEFHADCTDTIMWANASAESGHLYDQDFKYACFLPFSTSAIMRPLLHFFGLSLKTHIIGMTCFFILLTLFLVLLIREVTGSLSLAFTGTSVFLAMTLSTVKMREIFWGHTIYYSLGILFLLIGTYMYFRLLTIEAAIRTQHREGKNIKRSKIHKVIIFICLCIFMLLTGLDGITGFTLFVLPFAGAVFAEQFANTKHRLLSCKTAVIVSRVLIFFVMAISGVLINSKLIGKLVASYQDANSEFSDMNSWIDHLHALPMAWMRLLGVKSLPNVMFTDKQGVPNLIAIMASVILAVIPIIATCCYKKYGKDRKGRMMRIWVWIHWAVTAVNLMGYIFGVLSAADWRIIPTIGTSMILSILFVCYCVPKKLEVSRIVFLLMIPVIAAGVLNCNNVRKMKKDSYKQNTQFMLADYLEEEGLTKGYATFWNANSITVISGERIKVRDVNIDTDGVRMRQYQSCKRWYMDDPLQREYFLLLTSSEFDSFSASDFYMSEKPVRTSERVINGVDYVLLVYDHNIVSPEI